MDQSTFMTTIKVPFSDRGGLPSIAGTYVARLWWCPFYIKQRRKKKSLSTGNKIRRLSGEKEMKSIYDTLTENLEKKRIVLSFSFAHCTITTAWRTLTAGTLNTDHFFVHFCHKICLLEARAHAFLEHRTHTRTHGGESAHLVGLVDLLLWYEFDEEHLKQED